MTVTPLVLPATMPTTVILTGDHHGTALNAEHVHIGYVRNYKRDTEDVRSVSHETLVMRLTLLADGGWGPPLPAESIAKLLTETPSDCIIRAPLSSDITLCDFLRQVGYAELRLQQAAAAEQDWLSRDALQHEFVADFRDKHPLHRRRVRLPLMSTDILCKQCNQQFIPGTKTFCCTKCHTYLHAYCVSQPVLPSCRYPVSANASGSAVPAIVLVDVQASRMSSPNVSYVVVTGGSKYGTVTLDKYHSEADICLAAQYVVDEHMDRNAGYEGYDDIEDEEEEVKSDLDTDEWIALALNCVDWNGYGWKNVIHGWNLKCI